MTRNRELFLALSGAVNTESGMRILRRGDELPADALSGEAERLRALGAFGVPPVPEVDNRDELDLMNEELARQHAEETGELPEAQVDEVGNVAYLKAATIPEVLARVGDDAVLAKELIAAEIEGRGDEARSTLIEQLTEIADEVPAETEVEPETAAPAKVDYSELKQPQLKALLDERGIDYPKGVVANAKLIALLEGE